MLYLIPSCHSGHYNGDMVVWEARELKKLVHKGEHNGQITDLQKNVDGTMVISSCKVIRKDFFMENPVIKKQPYIKNFHLNAKKHFFLFKIANFLPLGYLNFRLG